MHSMYHFILNMSIISYIRLYYMYSIYWISMIYNMISRGIIILNIFTYIIILSKSLIHITIFINLLINNSFTTHHITTHNYILIMNIFINISIFGIYILFICNNFIFLIIMINILLSSYYFFIFLTTIHKYSCKKS